TAEEALDRRPLGRRRRRQDLRDGRPRDRRGPGACRRGGRRGHRQSGGGCAQVLRPRHVARPAACRTRQGAVEDRRHDRGARERVRPAQIGGRWADAADGKTFETVDPATGEVLARVAEAGAEDIDRAVAAARKSFDRGTWRDLPPAERAKVLWKIGDMIEERANEFAQLRSAAAGPTPPTARPSRRSTPRPARSWRVSPRRAPRTSTERWRLRASPSTAARGETCRLPNAPRCCGRSAT